MGVTSQGSSPSTVRVSKAWELVVAGFSMAAVGLVAFLTINGASGTPAAATLGTASLIVVGFLLPLSGMLLLRRGLGPTEKPARRGYALQVSGMLGLLLGVALILADSSISGFLLGAVFVVASGVSAVAGAVFLRGHFMTAASNSNGTACLMIGTALIFSGVGVIAGSNLAFEYLISQVENTVLVDVGATVSACGCVLASYSFLVLHKT